MSNVLVINAAGPETRVALVENGTISEFYLERKKDKGIVGNIYKGKVVRVLPGMQAAFVDIGLEKAAFLYVGDVTGGPDFSEEFDLSETPEGEHGEPPTGDIPLEDTPDITGTAASAAEGAPSAAASDEGISSPDAAADEPDDDAEASEPVEAAASDEPVAAEAVAAPEPPAAEQAEAPSPAVAAPTEVAVVKVVAPPQKLEPLARKRRRPDAKNDRGREREREASKGNKTAQIQDLLKEGQEVIVQVVKDPIGTKGARVTCHISLPGRHLVFMPTVDHVGISRRIDNERERRRLRELVDGLRPAGTGFIVRTVADGIERDKLVADIKFLLGIWNEMAQKKDRLRAPALLHPDLDLILRSIRDLLSHDVEKLVIDDRAEYERIVQFVEQNVPSLRTTIELYPGSEPIFDSYGIEQELTRALSRKVWLKSGGYLVIDQAEALVAIDINSGRFVGKKNLEETITAINIEAAKEIVYQLRLRNLGGVIIIDFIDMEKQPNREKVFKALQEALQKDRAKTNIVKISELGLVEMTRKRVRESVGRLLHEPCLLCEGRGFIKSKATIAYEIFRDIQREAASRREDTFVVSCQPDVARYIQQDEREALRNLMLRHNKTIQIKPQTGYRQEQFEVQARWSRRDEPPKRDRPERGPVSKPPATAPVIAAPVSAEGDDLEDGDDEGEEAPAAVPAPGAPPAAPGQAPTSRRRRRRRRRGGAAPAAGGAPAVAGTPVPPRPPEGS